MVKRSASRASLGTADTPTSRKRKFTVEQIISQKIRDNFKGLTPTETDSVTDAEGFTLRQRLAKDYEGRQRAGVSVVFGRMYYDGLKSVFAQPQEIFAALTPPASSSHEEVRSELVKAMLLAQGGRCDRSGFEAFFLSCTGPPNIKETCGIFRWAAGLKVGCVKQLTTAVAFLRFTVRLDLPKARADQWKHLRPWCDTVLCALLRKHRAQKCTDATFMQVNSDLLALVCCEKTVKKVADCKGDFKQVETELANLVGASAVARMLYEAPCLALLASTVDLKIAKVVQDLLKMDTRITLAGLDKLRADLVQTLESLGGIDGLVGKRREVVVDYRGAKLHVLVSTLAEEVSLKLAAAVKQQAVAMKVLPEMWVESWLCDSPPPAGPCDVEEAAIRAAKAARAALQEAVKDAAVSSSDMLAKVVGAKSATLLLGDPGFKIELALLSELTRSDDKGRLRQLVLNAFPCDATVFSAESAAQKLHVIAGGDIFRLSGRACQEKLRIAQGIVAAISEGRAPDLRSMSGDDFVASIAAKASYFVSFRKNEADAPVYGTAAVRGLLQTAVDKKGRRTLTLEDVTPLQVFGWLLNKAEAATVAELAKAAAGVAKASSAASSSSAGPPGGASTSASKAKSADTKAAMRKALDMFSS